MKARYIKVVALINLTAKTGVVYKVYDSNKNLIDKFIKRFDELLDMQQAELRVMDYIRKKYEVEFLEVMHE